MNYEGNVPYKEHKTRRRNMGISLEDFAFRVGVSALTLRRWEEGRTRPTKENLQIWCRTLDEAEEKEHERAGQEARY